MCVAWVADGLPPPKAASDNESLVEVCELLHRVKACRIFPPDRPPAFPSTLSLSLFPYSYPFVGCSHVYDSAPLPSLLGNTRTPFCLRHDTSGCNRRLLYDTEIPRECLRSARTTTARQIPGQVAGNGGHRILPWHPRQAQALTTA